MTVKKPLASLLLISWTTLAHADDFGTKALEANETRQAGKLVACSLDFRQTLMDFVPVPSRPVTVKGSFSIVAPNDPKKPAWVIQVAPQEAIIQAGKLFYQAFTPVTAYAITDGDYSTAGTQISTTACNGGGVCLLGQVGLVELFQGLIVATKIRVFYQRKTGAEDTEFAVALPWVGFPNHDTMTTFQSCVYKLLQIP